MGFRMLGFKLGMTQIWKDERLISVTVIKVPTAYVVAKKSNDKHGYTAIKVGAISVPIEKLNKPEAGLFKDSEFGYKYLYEIRDNEVYDLDMVSVSMFKKGEFIKLRGKSRGKGFAGVMKRYNFSGGDKAHGSMSHRRVGAIGCRLTPGRVFKGKKLPGHLGNVYISEMRKEIVDIITDKEIILLKGSAPGAKNSYVFLER